MRVVVGVVSCILALAATSLGGLAQGPPPPDPIGPFPGIEEAVARSFIRTGRGETGTRYIVAQVTRIDPTAPPAAQETALRTAGSALGRQFAQGTIRISGEDAAFRAGDFRPVSMPKIKESALGWTATSPDAPIDSAFMTVTWGNYVYTYAASGRLADPLDDLLAIVDSHLGESPEPRGSEPDAGYRTDGTWGRLVRLEHLPPGFALDREWVAVSSPLSAATPMSNP